MEKTMWWLITGIFIGANLGFVTFALLWAADT
jgi:type III secretory pathway component EscT